MKYLKSFAAVIMFTFLYSISVSGQVRYIDEVFNDIKVSYDVKYGYNYNAYINPPNPVVDSLFMDVYEPKTDTITERPLIILAHAGSFLPQCNPNQLPLGTKQDSSMVELCNKLAKRGYVVVSMDYRLGWNPISTDQDIRYASLLTAIYLANQDMKACIRYMKLNYADFDVDTNKVVVGGSNSGGYIALANGYLDDTTELQLLKFRHSVTGKPYIDWSTWGNIEGKNGIPGYSNYNSPGPSTKINLVLNLGGAIGDTTWIESFEVPVIAFHGVEDAMTPYKYPIGTYPPYPLEVHGSYLICRSADKIGIQEFHDQNFNDAYTLEANSKNDGHSGLFPFYGALNGFEPWSWYDENSPCIDTTCTGFGSAANPCASKTKALSYIDTILGYFCPRAVKVLKLPGNVVNIQDFNDDSESLKIYPNPASDWIMVKSEREMHSITIYDSYGKIILKDEFKKDNKVGYNVSNIKSGVYIIKIEVTSGTINRKLIIDRKSSTKGVSFYFSF